MNPAAFLDTNVPIYAAGRDHPLKESSARILRIVADDPGPLVTDSEVLQELMHLYLSSGRWALGRDVVWSFAEAMRGRIELIHTEDLILASELADHYPHVSARDMVHATVMQRLGVDRIISADSDVDRLEGIIRLDPASVGEWVNFIPIVPKA